MTIKLFSVHDDSIYKIIPLFMLQYTMSFWSSNTAHVHNIMGLSIRPTLYKISQLSLYSTLQPELRYYTSSQTRTPCQHTIIIQLANIYKITSVIFSFNTELVGTSIRYKSFSMQTIYKIINYGLSTKKKHQWIIV